MSNSVCLPVYIWLCVFLWVCLLACLSDCVCLPWVHLLDGIFISLSLSYFFSVYSRIREMNSNFAIRSSDLWDNWWWRNSRKYSYQNIVCIVNKWCFIKELLHGSEWQNRVSKWNAVLSVELKGFATEHSYPSATWAILKKKVPQISCSFAFGPKP